MAAFIFSTLFFFFFLQALMFSLIQFLPWRRQI